MGSVWLRGALEGDVGQAAEDWYIGPDAQPRIIFLEVAFLGSAVTH
jgi:hypothetical protein